MSFFSKITKEMDGLFSDDKKKKTDQPHEAQRAYESYPTQGYPPQGYPPPGQGYPPPQGYPPQPQYNSHPGYPPPVPAQPYGQPPAVPPGHPNSSLPPTPTVPPGFLPLWDPSSSRWAYLNQPNGTVTWEVPTSPAVAGHGAYGDGHDTRGIGGHDSHNAHYGGGYDSHGGHDSHGGQSSDKKNMMLGAAGGVAVGAIGGMVLANAMDDDHPSGAYAAPPPGPDQYTQYPTGNQEFPDETADGSSVSSSDKEDLEEARKEYEEQYEETYGSD